jgi:hypothetical protein
MRGEPTPVGIVTTVCRRRKQSARTRCEGVRYGSAVGRRLSRLFGPRETQNERLLREAGLQSAQVSRPAPEPTPDPEPEPEVAPEPVEADPVSGLPPVWAQPESSVPTYHRLPTASDASLRRLQEWRPLASANAPELRGAEILFFALEDGSVIVDEQEGDAPLDPLLDALDSRIEPPYKAQAIHLGAAQWSIAARPIDVVELPDVKADELTVARYADEVVVDDEPVADPAPYRPLEKVAAGHGYADYVAELTRLEDPLFAVQLTPL